MLSNEILFQFRYRVSSCAPVLSYGFNLKSTRVIFTDKMRAFQMSSMSLTRRFSFMNVLEKYPEMSD